MTLVDKRRRKWIGRLAGALTSDLSGSGLERSMCEQIVADAMESDPTPRTLVDLIRAVEATTWRSSARAVELIAVLRRQAAKLPDLRLEELVD